MEDFKRKLTVILHADVRGYSRLMNADEVSTLRTLKEYLEVMAKLISRHRGRVVGTEGDAILADFTSVVESVKCAVEIQSELAKKNEKLPANRKMEFRIGINIGDVIEEKDDIYGDGVNIAARIQALAEGGGICISGAVYDHVHDKLEIKYKCLKEQKVKNIARPVRVYRVLSLPGAAVKGKIVDKIPKERMWRRIATAVAAVFVILVGAVLIWNYYFRPRNLETAAIERMAFPLPDKPSIAVLPFTNLSGTPEEEYLADGITENIITALSQNPRMFVIARNSTFTYKGKPVKVQQVSEELGVRYVLEGSLQKSDNRIRLTAQLIDALSGHHLWADRYDREIKDLFALQDEIAMTILTELQVKLTEGERARLWGKGTDSIDAYLKLLQGREYFRRGTPDDDIIARRIFEEVIALDPDYPDPYIFIGLIHLAEIQRGTSNSPPESIKKASEFVQKALALDESKPTVHSSLGSVFLRKKEYEKAIAASERAVSLNPNLITGLFHLGLALSGAGRSLEAVPLLEKAVRLNPLDPSIALYGLGIVHRRLEQYDQAIDAFRKVLQFNPKFFGAHLNLAACYSATGREEEAQAAAAEVLEMNPKFSLQRFENSRAVKDDAVWERFTAALRQAGLPD